MKTERVHHNFLCKERWKKMRKNISQNISEKREVEMKLESPKRGKKIATKERQKHS